MHFPPTDVRIFPAFVDIFLALGSPPAFLTHATSDRVACLPVAIAAACVLTVRSVAQFRAVKARDFILRQMVPNLAGTRKTSVVVGALLVAWDVVSAFVVINTRSMILWVLVVAGEAEALRDFDP